MGLSGFMQDAMNSLRDNRALKSSIRKKFKGSHSDKAILDDHNKTDFDFSHLTPEQVMEEKKRIAQHYRKARIKRTVAFVVAIAITFLLFRMVYVKLRHPKSDKTGVRTSIPKLIVPNSFPGTWSC